MADPTRRRQAFLGRLAQLLPERAPVEVARNLGFVFNTRKACGSVIAGFGLGDYEREVNTGRAVEALRVELLTAVSRYEPRIREPLVRLRGGWRTRMVRFEIAGRVDGQACALDVDIDTTTRRVTVQVAEASRR
jgi:predicted component of type VI protein secretion system